MTQKVQWLTYEFDVYHKDGNWNDVGGIYIFAGTNPLTMLIKPFYIGKTESFRSRLPSHEQWDAALRLGASHVHAMVVPLEANRQVIESELIAHYQPPLNKQLQDGAGLGAVAQALRGFRS